MKTRVFISVFAFLLLASFAHAYPVKAVGKTIEEFNPFYITQRGPMWCWAASLEMVMRYYGLDISQEEIVFRIFGSDYAGRLNIFSGASAELISSQVNGWGVDRQGTQYSVRSYLSRRLPDNRMLINHLSNGGLGIIGYGPTPNSGHVVVLTGITYMENSDGSKTVRYFLVRDPDPSNQSNLGRKEYMVDQFPERINWIWLVNVDRNSIR